MSWLKMGCWVLLGAVAVAGASACGARGNLLGGEAFGGGGSAGRSFGGSRSFGGTPSVGGAPSSAGSFAASGTSFGGAAIGGSLSLGGVANIGGAGAPNVCKPGFTMCEDNVLEICTGPANGYIFKDCGPMQRCVQNGSVAACQPLPSACPPGTADCDGSIATGCESKLSTDPNNCTGCGLACSTNHVPAPTCNDGCTGKCAIGFEDCNGSKLKDGCEVNTSSDDKNCGSCGKVCSGGDHCASGACTSFVAFTGVAQSLKPQSLAGWSLCYSETYGQTATSLDSIRAACTGSLLMMACRPVGSETLQLAAYAPRADVLFDTGLGNDPHVANGVGWYFNRSRSWGFAPAGDTISRNSCDTQDSSSDPTGSNGGLRLCWHTGDDYVRGGWRCGRDDNLNNSVSFERLLFQAQ